MYWILIKGNTTLYPQVNVLQKFNYIFSSKTISVIFF